MDLNILSQIKKFMKCFSEYKFINPIDFQNSSLPCVHVLKIPDDPSSSVPRAQSQIQLSVPGLLSACQL